MTLQTSGAMTMYEIRGELGLGNVPIGLTDSNVRGLANVPTGDVEMPTDFYGKSSVAPYGTYLSQYCVGYNLYYRYADGSGGYYDQLYEYNSGSCGWPPPYGTFITSYCSGYNLYYRYADGTGGYYDELYQSNSSSCGWPPPATYQLTTTSTSVNEGFGFTVNVTTTHFNNGTGNGDLYWRIVHNTTTSADFDGNLDSGVSVVQNNSTSFTFYARADQITEGTENFYVVVSLTAGGPAVANTSTISINDTSTPPVITYSFSFLSNPIREGEVLYVTVTTTNYGTNGNGYMYWSIPSVFTTMENTEFANNITKDIDYYFSIGNNQGTFQVYTALDTTDETSIINPNGESFLIRLKDSSLNSVKLSPTILVNEWNEYFDGPTNGSPSQAYSMTIRGGFPNSSVTFTKEFAPNEPAQTVTLNENGTYTFTDLVFPYIGVGKNYKFTFTFAATTHVREYNIYIL